MIASVPNSRAASGLDSGAKSSRAASAIQPHPERHRTHVSVLRARALEMARRTSLRAVARGIGMSAQSLKLFLAGAHPREPTLRKLRAWYFGGSPDAADVSPDTALAAVQLLVEGLPDARRAPTVREMLAILVDSHARQGTPPPEWLEALRREQAPWP